MPSKLLTPGSLLAAVLFSLVVVIPFVPATHEHSDDFALEVDMTSTAAGHVQLYGDTGNGLHEETSSRLNLEAGSAPHTYRLGLPTGNYRGFRFDPIDRDGTITISHARIVGPDRKIIRAIADREFVAANQIQSLGEKDGRLEAVVTPGATDPQLAVTFDTVLPARPSVSEILGSLLGRAVVVFVLVIFVLWTLGHATVSQRLGAFANTCVAGPMRTVFLAALAAVVAANYPVVFLGRSFASPNFTGLTLLYDESPTLPRDPAKTTVDSMGSDVGALLWQHLPMSTVQHDALRHGELPLWNRYNSNGLPMLGQGQSMFGDPLAFLVALANGAAWAWDLKYLGAKLLFSLGLGLTVLKLARHLPSALLVTAAAPFLGFFVFRINHPAIFSVCYAPWALYCYAGLVEASTLRQIVRWAAFLIAANFVLMNSGTAKEAYMLLAGLNFSGACLLAAAAQTIVERVRKFVVLAGAGCIFVLISAPVWLTFLDTLARAYTSYDMASAYQIQPGLLLGAFDELFYRPLTQRDYVFNPSVNFLILAGLLYFLATLRLHFRDRIVMALAVSSLVPLALAFGVVPPQWVERLPFLSNVAHLDNTFTCVLLVLWSVLAGCGFRAAAQRLGTSEGRGDLAVASVLLFALVAAYVGFLHAVHRSIFGPGTTFVPIAQGQTFHFAPFLIWSLISLVAALMIGAFVARGALKQRRASAAAGLLLVLCGLVLVWRGGQQAPGAGFDSYVVRPPARADLHALSPAVRAVQDAERANPGRVLGLNSNLFPGWTGVYGLEGINGPDALMSRYYRELTNEKTGVDRIWDWRLYVGSNQVAQAHRFLDFLNVRYYFDLRSDHGKLGAELKPLKMADLDVYESTTAWPRAFFTDRIFPYHVPAEIVNQVRAGDGRPFTSALADDIAANPDIGRLSRSLDGRAVVGGENYRFTANTTSFDLHAPGPGLVTLTESYWPGDFRAEINGQQAKIIRVNHAFQAVAINAAGDYHISFRYWPRRFTLALGMAAVGLAALGLSLAWAFRRERPAAAPFAA